MTLHNNACCLCRSYVHWLDHLVEDELQVSQEVVVLNEDCGKKLSLTSVLSGVGASYLQRMEGFMES